MEVEGRTSTEDGTSFDPNRTNLVIYCDPCENEGDEQPAEGFCIDCQEYLCSPCFKIHRHHVLKDKESMPKSKTTGEQLNYECTEPCSEHPSKILEYFCQTHAKLGCPICVTENHRTCNDVDYIPNIADRFKESTEAKEVFKTLHILKEQVEKYSSRISNDKIKLKTYENDAKAQILQLRDEFNSICDRLVENVEDLSRCDEIELEDSLSTCEKILKKLKLRESVLEKKQEEMKLSQLFTEVKLSKLSAKEHAKELQMVKEHTKTRHYELKFDAEALRETFKLTFLDHPIEDDTLKQTKYPQTKEDKRGYVLNKGDADEINMTGLTNWNEKEKQTVDRFLPNKSFGKIKYDREFILQFRFCSYALQKPKHLPDVPDIILEEAICHEDVQETNDFQTSYRWDDAKNLKKKLSRRVRSSSVKPEKNTSDDKMITDQFDITHAENMNLQKPSPEMEEAGLNIPTVINASSMENTFQANQRQQTSIMPEYPSTYSSSYMKESTTGSQQFGYLQYPPVQRPASAVYPYGYGSSYMSGQSTAFQTFGSKLIYPENIPRQASPFMNLKIKDDFQSTSSSD